MRIVTQSTFGAPDVLALTQAERPRPLPTEVLVRVHATSVNPVDLYIRSGAFPLLGTPPFTLGWDISGVVEEVVPGTSRFKVGDEVYGMPLFPRPASAYAEYVAAPSRQLARKPRNATHGQAAGLALAGLTAYQALIDVAGVQAGQKVLVHGAGGGVGHLAVQIAKHLGAHVYATGSASKADFVRGLGVDEFIDYQSTDFTSVAQEVDVVFDLIGKDYGQRSLKALRPGGTLVTAVERTNLALAQEAQQAGRRFASVAVEPDGHTLTRLAEWVEAGHLRVHVDRSFDLREAEQAHAWVAQGSTRGKVALLV